MVQIMYVHLHTRRGYRRNAEVRRRNVAERALQGSKNGAGLPASSFS